MLIDLEVPEGLHPETRALVAGFAKALAEKLYAAEKKYGYSDGWLSQDWEDECRSHFLAHIGKGDPRDVAAYCAFMWKRGWPTVSKPVAALSSPPQADEREKVIEECARWHEYQAALVMNSLHCGDNMQTIYATRRRSDWHTQSAAAIRSLASTQESGRG